MSRTLRSDGILQKRGFPSSSTFASSANSNDNQDPVDISTLELPNGVVHQMRKRLESSGVGDGNVVSKATSPVLTKLRVGSGLSINLYKI